MSPSNNTNGIPVTVIDGHTGQVTDRYIFPFPTSVRSDWRDRTPAPAFFPCPDCDAIHGTRNGAVRCCADPVIAAHNRRMMIWRQRSR